MGLKEYFDVELKSVLTNAVAGAVLGYVAFIINNPLLNLLMAIVIFAVLSYILKKTIKMGREHSFYSVALTFFLAWLIVWTIFYNTRIV